MRAFLTLFRQLMVAMVVAVPMASTETAAAEPLVYLTHLSVTLDAQTYAAFRDSAAIAGLAASEQKHIVAGSQSWAGFYIYGRQTYIELFNDADLPPDAHAGDCSISLGVEVPGSLERIKTKLQQSFGPLVASDRITRQVGSSTIPWFTAVSIQSSPTPESNEIWFSETDADYLHAAYPAQVVTNPLSREEYLRAHFLPDRGLDNIVKIVSVTTPAQRDRFQKELAAAGWKLASFKRGFTARGPSEVFYFRSSSDGRVGIRSIGLALRHFHKAQTIKLGRAALRFDGMKATLTFF